MDVEQRRDRQSFIQVLIVIM